MNGSYYKARLRAAINELRDATEYVPNADEAELLDAVVLLQNLLTRKPVEVNRQDRYPTL